MRFMIRLGVLFYVTIILFLGCVMVLFALNLVPSNVVIEQLNFVYSDLQVRMIVGVVAVVLLLNNHIFSRAILGDQQKGKIIAFDNPSGRVSVSLSALEDLVKREISRIPEVREVRASIAAGRKGLDISSRLVLNTDVNIPEMTSNLQELVKRKIQDTIGIEEAVVVQVHVTKIVAEGGKSRRMKEKEKDSLPDASVPFQGYRA